MNCSTRCPLRLAAALCVALGFVCFASFSMAAAINYGDVPGTNVTFLDVTEDSATDPTPLYGPPTAVGDTLTFNSTSFNASSSAGAPPVDLTDGTLVTTILANPGKVIEKIVLSEAGYYKLEDTGTKLTQVAVSTTIFGKILAVDGTAISPLTLNGSMVFTPNAGGNFNLIDDPGTGVIWTGSVELDLSAALAAEGIAGKATKVLMSMDNTLLAISEDGSTAFIAKYRSGGVTTDVIVPEPSTLALLGFGLVGLLLVVRRRR